MAHPKISVDLSYCISTHVPNRDDDDDGDDNHEEGVLTHNAGPIGRTELTHNLAVLD